MLPPSSAARWRLGRFSFDEKLFCYLENVGTFGGACQCGAGAGRSRRCPSGAQRAPWLSGRAFPSRGNAANEGQRLARARCCRTSQRTKRKGAPGGAPSRHNYRSRRISAEHPAVHPSKPAPEEAHDRRRHARRSERPSATFRRAGRGHLVVIIVPTRPFLKLRETAFGAGSAQPGIALGRFKVNSVWRNGIPLITIGGPSRRCLTVIEPRYISVAHFA